ncbi:MAG TPA: hypothetical protein VHG89_03940 [Verrucomicrobiae bacterium]|nr:hypothetical protein [Verrucomicrobiae bacterium]
MNEEKPKTKSGWRWLRRILIALAVLATLIAIFYTEEDWRGKRAWENCKRELEAKGEVLDWNKFIPPPVLDESNFFAAPKMQEWFVGRGGTELSRRLQNDKTTPVVGEDSKIKTEIDAKNYLAWSDQFEPDFELIREALKRPYARMDGDYSQPYEMPIPNFITVRALAQTLAQRAHCYLLLNQPDKALDELTLLNDSRRLLFGAPTGKPMTLVAAMINVAVTGLYVDTIANGFQKQAWQEPQVIALQEQLKSVSLPPFVCEAFRAEQVSLSHTAEIVEFSKIAMPEGLFSSPPKTFWLKMKSNLKSYGYNLLPRGWVYQNMAMYASLIQLPIDSFEPKDEVVSPKKIEDAMSILTTSLDHYSPFKMLAALGIPNFTKAMQTTAHHQTLVNEAQIACALERYQLANGNYPETLDALAPQFIAQIPHDIISGQPLHYRRTSDGKFLLYSVGWNETDDGGADLSQTKSGSIDYTKGDWVWKN